MKRPLLAVAIFACAAVVVLLVASPNSHIYEAKEAVRSILIDSGSAKFSDVYEDKAGHVCGLVNAKNRMGGYTGDSPFFYTDEDKKAVIVEIVTEEDFQTAWSYMKAGPELASHEIEKLSTGCEGMKKMAEVCKNTPIHPLSIPKLCNSSGSSLMLDMEREYGGL